MRSGRRLATRSVSVVGSRSGPRTNRVADSAVGSRSGQPPSRRAASTPARHQHRVAQLGRRPRRPLSCCCSLKATAMPDVHWHSGHWPGTPERQTRTVRRRRAPRGGSRTSDPAGERQVREAWASIGQRMCRADRQGSCDLGCFAPMQTERHAHRFVRDAPPGGARTGEFGGPDRIRTGDLQRDRLACWAATPRVRCGERGVYQEVTLSSEAHA